MVLPIVPDGNRNGEEIRFPRSVFLLVFPIPASPSSLKNKQGYRFTYAGRGIFPRHRKPKNVHPTGKVDLPFGLNADGDKCSWRSLRAGLTLKPAQNIEFSFHSLHLLLMHFCRGVVPLTVTLEALAIFHLPIELMACAIAREPFLDGALAHGEIGSEFFKHNAKVEFLSF